MATSFRLIAYCAVATEDFGGAHRKVKHLIAAIAQ